MQYAWLATLLVILLSQAVCNLCYEYPVVTFWLISWLAAADSLVQNCMWLPLMLEDIKRCL